MNRFQKAWQLLRTGRSEIVYSKHSKSMMLGGSASKTSSLGVSKKGAAEAYLSVAAVHSAVNLIVDNVDSLRWVLKRRIGKDSEEVIAESDKLATSYHPFAMAFKQFESENGQSVFSFMEYDYLLYGETYWELAKNDAGFMRQLEWLNPLNVTLVLDRLGFIEGYRYRSRGISEDYDLDEVAYAHTRNPLDDNHGYSLTMAAIEKINLARHFEAMLDDYFKNNGRPGAMLTPASEDQTLSDDDIDSLRRQFSEQIRGIGNFYSTLISRVRLNMDTFDNPDLATSSDLSGAQIDQIYEIYRTPRAMLGNTTNQPYKNGDETTRQFYRGRVIPDSDRIAQFVNTDVLPFFDSSGDVYMEFDTSIIDETTEGDKLELEVVNQQLTGGYITVAEAARLQERPVEDWMEDRYMYNGLPMTIEQINMLVEGTIAAQSMLPAMVQSTATDVPKQSPKPRLMLDVTPSTTKTACACEDDHCIHKTILPLYEGDDLFPDEDTITERIEDEIKRWRGFELKRFQKINRKWFKPNVLPTFVHSRMIDLLDQCETHDDVKGIFTYWAEDTLIKSLRSYSGALRELATAFWRDEISTRDFRSRMKNLIQREYTNAIKKGLDRGNSILSDLTDDDKALLDEMIETEQNHVNELVVSILDKRRASGSKLRPLRSQLELWSKRWLGVEQRAFAIASKTKKLVWKWDARKEHCISCRALNGQVRKGAFWVKSGIWPQSSKLACFGLYCGCTLVEAPKNSTLSRGRLPKRGWR